MSEVMSLTEICGPYGELPSLAYKGAKYKAIPPSPETMKRVELWLIGNEKADLDEAKANPELMLPGQYEEMEIDYKAMVKNKDYRYGGKLWKKMIEAPDSVRGTALMLWSCLPPSLSLENVIEIFAEQPVDCFTLMETIMPDFLKVVSRQVGAPISEGEMAKARAQLKAGVRNAAAKLTSA